MALFLFKVLKGLMIRLEQSENLNIFVKSHVLYNGGIQKPQIAKLFAKKSTLVEIKMTRYEK
jgi:hypothetical protein